MPVCGSARAETSGTARPVTGFPSNVSPDWYQGVENRRLKPPPAPYSQVPFVLQVSVVWSQAYVEVPQPVSKIRSLV